MHTRRRPIWLWLALVPMAAQGAAFQSPESIREAASAVLGAQDGVVVVVDAQLRLPSCRQPLQARVANARNVAVRCDDAPGWQLYLPVRGRAEAAAAPSSPAAPPASGRRLRPVSLPEAPVVVAATGESLHRGDPVVLVSRAGGIEVRMGGRALGPAHQGGTVTVENTSTRRILRGRLVAAGEVEVVL